MQKVFGIGWAKTGTKTLGKCFRILGYRNKSQDQQALRFFLDDRLDEIVGIAEDYDSFEDWPWLLMYKKLDESYPGSRFILTSRNPVNWLQSYRGMLCREGLPSPEKTRLRRKLYGLPFPEVTDAELCERVRLHNQNVTSYFMGRPNLLVVDWEKGHGWQEVCAFLELDCPAEPFPHENRAPI